jgi:hypothetical protein
MRFLLYALLAVVSSCAANSAALGDAAVGTATGLMAAGVSRSSGDCYASCPPGNVCDSKTGLCVELPCRGQCGLNEVCDTGRALPVCVPARSPELQIGAGSTEPARITPQ